MKKFKKGDRVKLITPRFGDNETNPVWEGACGKIIGTLKSHNSTSFPWQVDWDNGFHNGYGNSDLAFAQTEWDS